MYKKIWNKFGLEILVLLSVILICIFYLFSKNKHGTWNKYIISYGTPVAKDCRVKENKNNYGNSPLDSKDSKGEIECRRVLEKIFNRKFDKARPNFLSNPITGNNFNFNEVP